MLYGRALFCFTGLLFPNLELTGLCAFLFVLAVAAGLTVALEVLPYIKLLFVVFEKALA